MAKKKKMKPRRDRSPTEAEEELLEGAEPEGEEEPASRVEDEAEAQDEADAQDEPSPRPAPRKPSRARAAEPEPTREQTAPPSAANPTHVSSSGGLIFMGVLFGLMALAIAAMLLID